MYKVEMIKPEKFDETGYNLTLMDNFKDYSRRLIIKLNNPIGRDIYNKPYNTVQRDFNPEIYELTPPSEVGDFPGYNNILLNYKDLQYIINTNSPKWKNTLSNVKGVYCITDKLSGRIYIGSASSDTGGIWERWASYAENLTGGNKTFEEIKAKDPNYIIENFTYSILEIFDMKTKRENIIHREEHWKRVFQTNKFGMNNVNKKN